MRRLLLMVACIIFCSMSGIHAYAGQWQLFQGGWAYQRDDGNYEANTWFRDSNGLWYYFHSNGYMATGWIFSGGHWYYLDQNSGAMVSNAWVGNYYLGHDGAMLVNAITPDGFKVGSDGAWVQDLSKIKVTSVELVEYEEGDSSYYWTAYGCNADGVAIWSYNTSSGPRTELESVKSIGIRGDAYYLHSNDGLVKLNKDTGEVIWINKDFKAGSISYAWGKDDTLYLCGYYGPDFCEIDKNGRTIKLLRKLSDQTRWADDIIYRGDKVAVHLENYHTGKYSWFYVDLSDYSIRRE